MFDWWRQKIPSIKDYLYAGISFLRDPDMSMPPYVERGEIGMYSYIFFNFLFYLQEIKHIFVNVIVLNQRVCYVQMWN
jgi:hypothetical protein